MQWGPGLPGTWVLKSREPQGAGGESRKAVGRVTLPMEMERVLHPYPHTAPREFCAPPQDLMGILDHLGCTSMSDEGGNCAVASAPRNRMRKASWKMWVALPCQAHVQGLSALNLLGSRIFSSGKEGGISQCRKRVTSGKTHLWERRQ